MKISITSVFGVPGRFYEGEFPGTICFVPVALVASGQLDQPKYVLEGWASLNITRAALSTCGRAKSKFLSVDVEFGR